MKQGIFRLLLVVLFGVIIVGCVSRRYGAVALVQDVGEVISTRHRYRIVRSDEGGDDSYNRRIRALVGDEMIEAHIGIFTNEVLARVMPSVFSDDGIEFKVHHCHHHAESKYTWTQVLCGFSLTIIPECGRDEHVHSYKIEMQEDKRIGESFEIMRFSEFALSILPTSFVFWGGMPDCDGKRLYCKSEKVAGVSYLKDRGENCPDIQDELLSSREKAFAYAVAKRLKELENSGVIDELLRKREAEKSKAPPHRVERLSRDSEKDFAYDFALELESVPSNPSETVRAVIHDFAKAIVEDYADTFPHAKKDLLRVAFSGVSISGMKISGKASVLTIAPLSLSYDANTRRGKLSVRFNPGQADESRKWILENIATLARDKNIMLTTGSTPPPGSFSICEEKVDGSMLEIEFKTE